MRLCKMRRMDYFGGVMPWLFFSLLVVFVVVFVNEILHGPRHGSQMKGELFCLELGCLLGSPCSPGAAPKTPGFLRSQCEYHWIRLSSSPFQLCNYTPWWGSHSRVLCLYFSHLCDSVPTGEGMLGKALGTCIRGSPWWLTP